MVFLCELCMCVGCVLLVCLAWVFLSGCGACVVCVCLCVWGGVFVGWVCVGLRMFVVCVCFVW